MQFILFEIFCYCFVINEGFCALFDILQYFAWKWIRNELFRWKHPPLLHINTTFVLSIFSNLQHAVFICAGYRDEIQIPQGWLYILRSENTRKSRMDLCENTMRLHNFLLGWSHVLLTLSKIWNRYYLLSFFSINNIKVTSNF